MSTLSSKQDDNQIRSPTLKKGEKEESIHVDADELSSNNANDEQTEHPENNDLMGLTTTRTKNYSLQR